MQICVFFLLMQYWPSEAYFPENVMHVILYFFEMQLL